MANNDNPLDVDSLLQKAEQLCKRRLENDPENRAVLRSLAEVSRKLGNLGQAGEAYERLFQLDPQDCDAGYARAVFGGKEWPVAPKGVRPAPLVLLRDFLAPDFHDALVPFLASARGRFVPMPEGGGGYQPRQCQALDFPDDWEGKHRFTVHLRDALARAIPRLHLPPFEAGPIEVFVRACQDRHLFKMHRDASRNSHYASQVINFVYYFHKVPRPCAGGELLLFDSDIEADTFTTTRFTRVVPEDNSVIMFPCGFYHSVAPIRCPSKEFADSRFVIAGFVRKRMAATSIVAGSGEGPKRAAATDTHGNGKFGPFRQQLFDTPELFPVYIDRCLDRFVFTPMTREHYRSASFHDQRVLDNSSERIEVGLDELSRLYAGRQEKRRFPHFIFHTAFGGSTLLSRYLDRSGHFFSYREPMALTQLAKHKHRCLRGVDPSRWAKALGMTVSLLARTQQSEEVSVVKLHDGCNNLFDELLCINRESRGLVLYSDLASFLLATLKTTKRRGWVRFRIAWCGGDVLDEMRSIDTTSLSDAEACSYLWLAQTYTCRLALDRHPTLLRSLDSQSLFRRPCDTLSAIGRLFGKPFSRESIDEIVAVESKVHAKTREEFDVSAQTGLGPSIGQDLTEEIQAGIAWANEHLSKTGSSLLPLPSPLLEEAGAPQRGSWP